jgi:hypothetical protein
MLSQINSGRSAFANFFFDRIASYRSADQLISRHAAKLIETSSTG